MFFTSKLWHLMMYFCQCGSGVGSWGRVWRNSLENLHLVQMLSQCSTALMLKHSPGSAYPSLLPSQEKKKKRASWELPRLSSWVTESPSVSEGLCSAPPAVSVTVSLTAQKYTAESLQWAECFFRLKEVSSFLNSASKSFMPLTRVFPEKYLRTSWSPWLGHCRYQ